MSLTIITIAAAATAHADGTADLRAALAKFPARQTLRATVSLESELRDDDKEPRPRYGRGSVEVEHDPNGVRVLYTPDTVVRAQQEARANGIDPEKQKPTVRALTDLDAIALLEALDAASVLGRAIDNGKLTKDERLPAGGTAIRRLTFAIRPKISKSDAKRISRVEMTLIVQLGADGVPLSAASTYAIRAKWGLMTVDGDEEWTFGRAGDHLVALRHHRTHNGSGIGPEFHGSTTTTVTVK